MRLISTALLAAALFLGAPVCADAAITLKAAYTNVEEHPQADGYALFKKLVEERSKGDIKIELYGSGKFGYADAIMQGLQMGVLTIGGEETSAVTDAEGRAVLTFAEAGTYVVSAVSPSQRLVAPVCVITVTAGE